jgi:hypothetical protein
LSQRGNNKKKMMGRFSGENLAHRVSSSLIVILMVRNSETLALWVAIPDSNQINLSISTKPC